MVMQILPTAQAAAIPNWSGLILLSILALSCVAVVRGLFVLTAKRAKRGWVFVIAGLAGVAILLDGLVLVGWQVSQHREAEAEAVRLHANALQQFQRNEAARARSEFLDSLDIEPPDVVPMPTLPSDFAQARVIEERAPRMSVGFIGLLIPLVALLGLGLIAVFIYLMSVASLKTRGVVLVVGAGLAAFVVLVCGLFFGRSSTSHRVYQRAALEATPEPFLPDRPVEIPLDPPHTVEGFPTATQTTAIEIPADEPEAKSLLHTIGVAVGRAISAAQDEIAKEAAKELARTAETASAASAAVPARPEWVDREPDRNAKGNYQMPISVGPFATRNECQDALNARLQDAVGEYARTSLGTSGRVMIRLPLSYIREHVIQDEWEEWKQYSPPLGEMVKLHVLLEFDRQTNARLQEEWKHVVVGRRLRGLAAVGGVLLALLATAWGYLRIDLATEGRNRSSLRFGAAGVALAVLATGAVFLA